MILTNRLFAREAPSREAKSIYIFCEGAKREYQYFMYFKEIDSRINIEIYKLDPEENNSPFGLLEIAKKTLIKTAANPTPKYEFIENDEVWLVFDTDLDRDNSRKPQIQRVRTYCRETKDWFVAQSNPCFEVWLYYHKGKEKPELEQPEICKNWKELVQTLFGGGFHSSRHPIHIREAITNSKANFNRIGEEPDIGATEVFNLGEIIYSLIKEKIDDALTKI